MRLLSRALAWVEAVLFGPPDTAPTADRRAARDTNTGTTATTSPGHRQPPLPEMWAAFLASARRRRARCPWAPAELPAIAEDDIASTLVGAYLILPEARQRARQARQFAEVS